MIPYFVLISFTVGVFTIQVWGLLVSLGITAGLLFSYYLCKRKKIDSTLIMDIAVWALPSALIGGRLFYALFYAPRYFLENPIDILKFWQGGASSLGGFFGAVLAVWFFMKKKKIRLKDFLPHLDIAILGLWLGWGIGRIGCFFIHDHPGRMSSFLLAVNFPNGARHDLGLYESILGFIIFIVFFLIFIKFKNLRIGFIARFSIIFYAVARFFLDFLRADDLPISDARYFYLTIAQWGMLFLAFGLTFLPFFNTIGRRIQSGRVA